MNLFEHINGLYSLSGFGIGALVGCTGIGGGSLMTPLLVLLFGITPSTAVGTDLLYAAITKAGGTTVHSRHGTIDWQITRRLVTGSAPTALATVFVLSQMGRPGPAANAIITQALGVSLFLTAVAIVVRSIFLQGADAAPSRFSPRMTHALTVLLGAVMGVLVTVTSVGAGAIGVTVLLMLYPRLPAVRIVGADIAHAVPLTLIAGLGHWYIGTIDWGLLISLLIGSLPGIALGSYFAARAPERLLSLLLAATLVLVGSKLVF